VTAAAVPPREGWCRRRDGDRGCCEPTTRNNRLVRLPVALLASLALVVFLVLTAIPASASPSSPSQYQPKKYIARHCSASRNICIGIFASRGIVFQLLIKERYFARYRICVRPPKGAKTCRLAPINPQTPVYGSHVRWPRRFGDNGPGIYRVSWSQAGHLLGPPLRFTRR
jgi:hypothetical protein